MRMLHIIGVAALFAAGAIAVPVEGEASEIQPNDDCSSKIIWSGLPADDEGGKPGGKYETLPAYTYCAECKGQFTFARLLENHQQRPGKCQGAKSYHKSGALELPPRVKRKKYRFCGIFPCTIREKPPVSN